MTPGFQLTDADVAAELHLQTEILVVHSLKHWYSQHHKPEGCCSYCNLGYKGFMLIKGSRMKI